MASALIGVIGVFFLTEEKPVPDTAPVEAVPESLLTPAPVQDEKPIQYEIPPVTSSQEQEPTTPSEPPPPPLPELGKSDPDVLAALSGVMGESSYIELFFAEKIIERFVVTVDNMTSPAIPAKSNLLKPAAGKFLVQQTGKNEWVLDPENYQRYELYFTLLESIKLEDLVSLYVRHYPLFQQAYENLGYPDGYFNDRLIEVLDHLLEAPEITEPVVLTRRIISYHYKDKQLENLSAGQKIMLRIGSENANRMRSLITSLRKLIVAVSGKEQ